MSRSNALRANDRTILVADDDDDMRALMTTTLRGDGYKVLEASDGGQLLEMLRDAVDGKGTLPDLVVTDVRMPRLSGLGVLHALRRAGVRIPVILVTVFGDESMYTVSKRLGAVGVLKKPFDLDDLRTAVLNASLAFEKSGRLPASEEPRAAR